MLTTSEKEYIAELQHRSRKYLDLLCKVDWFFETEDALRAVHLRLIRGKTTLETYRELSAWAGDIESELRREVEGNDT